MRRLSGAVLLSLAGAGFAANPAGAQSQQAIVGPEDAVVTGFSGAATGPAPNGADPLDYLVIPPDGPAARVIDLSRLGGQGGLSDVAKPFTVKAGQVGQVFGVALDDAPAPSIYLAATSAYGLSIGLADASGGGFKRLLHGLQGAEFLPNQFGPAAQRGGPTSIWRVDGTTGQVTLFANIGDEGVNAAASLGGLAYDPRSQQIFAADRATGLIHKLSLDGTDRGTFDHGLEARPANGLAEAPLTPVTVDIASQSFDTEQPATWGYADPERLVFALAMRDDRLFYSVAAGPEIWSVGINRDGSFARDARFETAVEALGPGMEVSSIAFDNRGLLYVAERAPPTGAYDFTNVAEGGNSRVLRFRAKTRVDSEPGLWQPVPEQYAVGQLPDYRNADGGVALGRGYDSSGRIQMNACAVTLWSTGEQLLGDAPSVEPVDGLQGNDTQLVLPTNAPPTNSWFIAYGDKPGDRSFSGHMGAVVTLPCEAAPVPGRRVVAPPPPPRFSEPLPPPPPVLLGCPVGTFLVGDTCLLPPSCPIGTRFRDGYCVSIGCPPDMIRLNGTCLPPPIHCERYETFVDGRCIPWRCPPDLVRMPNGYCGCPRDEIYVRGQCIPQRCPPDMFMTRDGRCLPPQGCRPPMFMDRNGRCVPPVGCRPPLFMDRYGRCVPPQGECRPPMVRDFNGRCVPPQGECRPPMVRDFNGRCVPPQGECRPPMVRDNNGRCVPPQGECRPPMVRDFNGRCVPPQGECRPPMVRDNNGRCVPPQGECRPPMVRDNNGRCVPPQGDCRPPMVRDNNGRCVPPQGDCRPPMVRDDNGRCVPPQGDCRPPMVRDNNGRCVPPQGECRPPQIRDDNGRCVAPPGRPCPRGQERADNGRCRPVAQQACPDGQVRRGNRCLPVVAPPVNPGSETPNCGRGQRLVNGSCVDIRRPQPQSQDCPDGTVSRRGRCVPTQAQQPDRPNRPAPVECGPDQRLRNGRCVDVPPQRQRMPRDQQGQPQQQPDRQRPDTQQQRQRDNQPQRNNQQQDRKRPDCPEGTTFRRGQCMPNQQGGGDNQQRPQIRLRDQIEKLQQQQQQQQQQ
ncbi:hypothetical protein [Kaistia sp. MMO-174]|uniref:hypothetical protein n=1 Tax=Kaistia sp. MMO-174 TaxID=3081256 RepID=UPI00301B69C4